MLTSWLKQKTSSALLLATMFSKVFGDRSILLLLDEFFVYVENAMGLVVGDSTFGRQVLTFVQKLTEVVRDHTKTVLVCSLPAFRNL